MEGKWLGSLEKVQKQKGIMFVAPFLALTLITRWRSFGPQQTIIPKNSWRSLTLFEASPRAAMSSDAMMRHLLGSDKKVVHDPGPKGESGEGDAALVMIFLVIAAATIITIYGERKNATLRAPRRRVRRPER